MPRRMLWQLVRAFRQEMREVLQLIYDTLNAGQRKQILKHDNIRKKFDQYGVEYEKNEGG